SIKRGTLMRARCLRDQTTTRPSEERTAFLRSTRRSELSRYGWKVDMWESFASQWPWGRFVLPSAMAHIFRCARPGCADWRPSTSEPRAARLGSDGASTGRQQLAQSLFD